MAYDPNIPQPTDDLSDSQVQLLANFQQLDTSFGINHFQYSDASSDNGKHKKLDFPTPTTVGVPVGDDSVIYPKAVSAVSSPYFRNSVGDSVMWRGGSTNGLVAETLANPGLLNLPNGFQMKFGQSSFSGAGTQALVTYAAAFPTATLCVQVTRAGGNTGTDPEDIFLVTLASAAAFTARRMSASPSNNLNFYWLAIGH